MRDAIQPQRHWGTKGNQGKADRHIVFLHVLDIMSDEKRFEKER
jgi:hypothetical protein